MARKIGRCKAALTSAGYRRGEAPPKFEGNRRAFRCTSCGQWFGDPLYHGAAGHAPPGMCLECWLWAKEKNLPTDLPVEVQVVWLMANGYTQKEVAARLKFRSGFPIYRLLRKWRSDPDVHMPALLAILEERFPTIEGAHGAAMYDRLVAANERQ